MSSWQMFVFGGGKCPNLGVVNVRILGVVNVRLANNLTPGFRSLACHLLSCIHCSWKAEVISFSEKSSILLATLSRVLALFSPSTFIAISLVILGTCLPRAEEEKSYLEAPFLFTVLLLSCVVDIVPSEAALSLPVVYFTSFQTHSSASYCSMETNMQCALQGWTPRPAGKGGFPTPPRAVGRGGFRG